MINNDETRLVVWSQELRAVHGRLRKALEVARSAVASGSDAEEPTRDLLLFCHGFCTALAGHHTGEDRTLFPVIATAHPELRDTLRKLEQDHSMMAHLLGGLQSAVARSAQPEELDRHLEGLAAIMESHFRYEERELLGVLDTLQLTADRSEALGPL